MYVLDIRIKLWLEEIPRSHMCVCVCVCVCVGHTHTYTHTLFIREGSLPHSSGGCGGLRVCVYS